MKRYQHLVLGTGRVTIDTTDPDVAQAIVHNVEQLIGGKIIVERYGYRWLLTKLRSRDGEVCTWAISWLCANGWEPYAVVNGGEIPTSGSTYLVYCFRREMLDSPSRLG